MFILDNKQLQVDVPFEVNGTKYPANWLRMTTLEEKLAIGITEVPDPVRHDDRFYWDHDLPKQLEDIQVEQAEQEAYTQAGLKTQWITQVKDTANKMLAPTDWMIIRKLDRGVEVPAEVVKARDAIVAECARLEAAIRKCKTVEALIKVVNNQKWQ